MKRSLSILFSGWCLVALSACTTGESKLTSGAAAGAGISALLGNGGNSPNSGFNDEVQGDTDVPATGEDGLRYYGPF